MVKTLPLHIANYPIPFAFVDYPIPLAQGQEDYSLFAAIYRAVEQERYIRRNCMTVIDNKTGRLAESEMHFLNPYFYILW